MVPSRQVMEASLPGQSAPGQLPRAAPALEAHKITGEGCGDFPWKLL